MKHDNREQHGRQRERGRERGPRIPEFGTEPLRPYVFLRMWPDTISSDLRAKLFIDGRRPVGFNPVLNLFMFISTKVYFFTFLAHLFAKFDFRSGGPQLSIKH